MIIPWFQRGISRVSEQWLTSRHYVQLHQIGLNAFAEQLQNCERKAELAYSIQKLFSSDTHNSINFSNVPKQLANIYTHMRSEMHQSEK